MTGCGFFFGTRPVIGADQNFSGGFEMIGDAGYGEYYKVQVTSRKAGDGYHMYWKQDGELTFYAEGMASGDLIAAVYASVLTPFTDVLGGTTGVVAYLRKDGLLTGLWANWEEPWLIFEKQPGARTLEPEFTDVAGNYRLQGIDSSGEEYSGELTLMLIGDTWQGWGRRGSSVFDAYGLVMGGKLVLATDDGAGLGIGIYEIGDAGELTGGWIYSTYEDMVKKKRLKQGSEQATRR